MVDMYTTVTIVAHTVYTYISICYVHNSHTLRPRNPPFDKLTRPPTCNDYYKSYHCQNTTINRKTTIVILTKHCEMIEAVGMVH
jgi:hypothetical protein